MSQIASAKQRFHTVCPPGLTQHLSLPDDDDLYGAFGMSGSDENEEDGEINNANMSIEMEELHFQLPVDAHGADKKISFFERFSPAFKELASVWGDSDDPEMIDECSSFFNEMINKGWAKKAGPAGAKVSSSLPISSELVTHDAVKGKAKKRRQLARP